MRHSYTTQQLPLLKRDSSYEYAVANWRKTSDTEVNAQHTRKVIYEYVTHVCEVKEFKLIPQQQCQLEDNVTEMRSSFCHRIALRAPFLQSPLLNPEAESTRGLVLLMISLGNLVLAGTMKEKETGMEKHIEVRGRDAACGFRDQAT